MDRHAEKMRAVVDATLNGPGELSPGVRQAIADERLDEAPPALRSYLEKVAHHAYRVTDDDVEALKRAGLSEDQIFEATVAAAVGAGLKRLRAGLAALGE